jgi:acyl-CoA reductase-like NAD-dependent aldehyde dehydrogenase
VSAAVPEPTAALSARLDAARAGRAALRSRPVREIAAALAAAAVRWRADARLEAALPGAARLSPELARAAVSIAAEAVAVDTMIALAERAWGLGAGDRPAPAGPALIAHVLASNVPALALPAIALACLAGAAVLVKSGRDDPVSAPAFVDALAALDPALAATIVSAYWPGGEIEREELLLGAAEVVIATGSDATLKALGARRWSRLVTHGPRVSVAAIGRAAVADADVIADALATDIALHDQRGCLSPHAIYVEAGGTLAPRAFAERLAVALETVARRLPPGPARVEERAARRLFASGAEWASGVVVDAGSAGIVVCQDEPAFRPSPGFRTVRVYPLPAIEALAPLLPNGTVECVGLAGIDPNPLLAPLAARGVSRLCPVGRMQRPPLDWPRGQRPALGVLLGRNGPETLVGR